MSLRRLTPLFHESINGLLGLVTQVAVMALIVIYSVQVPGTPETPRKVVTAFCPIVELPPGMSMKGAAVSFMSKDFPVADSEVREAFDAIAYQVGVVPSLPLFGGRIKVCLRPESLDQIETIEWIS